MSTILLSYGSQSRKDPATAEQMETKKLKRRGNQRVKNSRKPTALFIGIC
ncbi:unknown [[Mannheimia] succiniciproducens MBEL55E]|uniref:Uncharacterized protein n=1 Tax=Mannheimia succiniciproducens (strain KCTC 0769BP / MBEL55E) TaxID=221988 RepID=Q65QS3_MANSM|nr:unknown [[Mannheimia] succiniciproducens MBEL55E]